ncbi:MAG: N-6 DNA methylase [Candidatus Altiarchaeota archaeon]|nr:N-6 DNA methylase [Candidatus Altiarchaeota archaeon]
MLLLFNLSGEHPRLPEEEVKAVLKGEGVEYSVFFRDEGERILILDVSSEDYAFVNRLSLTRKAGLVASLSSDLKQVADEVFEVIGGAGSFAVRCSEKDIRMDLGQLLSGKGLVVDLDNPKREVYCMNVGGRLFSCINLALERDFGDRVPKKRPFFHPTSLHPKTARLLVNLARVKPGDVVLDPFCGTCGILIEAGLMGLQARGFDVDRRMVAGCRRNLEFYDLEGEVDEGDALELDDMKVDAIVSDLPYGRSSYLTDRNLDSFYRRFMDNAIELVRMDGHIVCVLPMELDIDVKGLTLLDRFEIYIHKSLTRRVYVFRRV